MSKPVQTTNISVELREEQAEGIYANLALITHSQSEFILDFARLLPGLPKARIHARIVMTPQNFKNLQRAITENIGKYEAQYGPIKIQSHPGPTVNFDEPLPDEPKKIH